MERIIQLYQRLTGSEPREVKALAGAGSNRQYFRLMGEKSNLIAVIGTNAEENEAFIALADSFGQGGLPVPKVLAVSDDRMVYLQEDCGDLSLYALMAQCRQEDGTFSKEAVDALQETIRILPRFQFLPVTNGEASDLFCYCYPQREMDRTSVMFDLNYFKYCFLKLKGVEFNEYKLQQDLERLADDLLKEETETFLYRDFQSRNVMLKDGKPYFIDFQGGRKGPIYYDVASFLWQSSARFSDSMRDSLIDVYVEALQPYKFMTKADFMQRLHLFVLFRLLQVLGAYGYRGLWEKKTYFIKSIPQALANLSKELAQGTCHPYPYLEQVCGALITRNIQEEEEVKRKAALLVRVFSFSFKKGIPEDESGNGGGYVFDCRSTHNPGRYDEYKPLTGLDKPIIDFLEADGEILTFLESVYKIVDFHVARYIERGFTNLQVSFGCTGGRHRSVYSAQHVAEHIHKKFGVDVRICHREQGITQLLTSQS
jgi:aminoglycoside/choline kinase family phosphotransferase